MSTNQQIQSFIRSLQQEPRSVPVAVDLMSSIVNARKHWDAWSDPIAWLAFGLPGQPAVVIKVQEADEQAIRDVLEALQGRLIVGHGLQLVLSFLRRRYGYKFRKLFCTETTFRVLHNGLKLPYDLDSVVRRELNCSLHYGSLSDELEERIGFVWRLQEHLWRELVSHKLKWTCQLEMKVLPVTVEMWFNGIGVDRPAMERLEEDFRAEAQELRRRLQEMSRQKNFNPDSPKQVEKEFEVYGIELKDHKRKTLLRELPSNEFTQTLIKYRWIAAMAGDCQSYLDAIREDGRIHAHLDPLGTETGRFSCSKPNLTGVPKRRKPSPRAAFVAEDGNVLVRADANQVEVRLLAAITGEPALLQAFKDSRDVHKMTASGIFGKREEDISKDERNRAKAPNFGMGYGMTAEGLLDYLCENGIFPSLDEAQDYIDKYFEAYPAVLAYKERCQEQAELVDYVRVLPSQRRRFLPDPGGRDRKLLNTPVQGACADTFKLALITLYKRLPSSATIVLVIHDEVVVECPAKDAEVVAKILKEVMEERLSFLYPEVVFKVDCNGGKRAWGDE